MSVLYIKDKDGKFIPIPTIKGEKGDKGKYFIPSLSTYGYLTFTASEPNEDGQYEYISSSISLKGPQGNPGKDAPSDVVRYNAQGLSEDQQNQARENIGAVSEEDVYSAIEEVVGDFGGTVEITSGLPQNTQTVLTIDPSRDETINLYTAEEIDDMVGSLSEEKADKFTVGEGLQMDGDVLEVKGSGNYELLNTITLEEEVAEVLITTDMDGKPLKYIKSVIEVEYGGTENSSIYTLAGKLTAPNSIYYNSIAYCYSSYSASRKYSAMKVEQNNGYWDMVYYAPADKYNTRTIQAPPEDMYMRFGTDKYPYLDMVRVYANTGGGTTIVPIGTVIKVWGVRA